MPTAKPRVQVTLEPETHAVIERLARLQGRTRGSIIAELLDSIAPTLTRTVALLEAAMEAPNDVKRGLRAVVEGVHDELVQVSGEASAQLDMLLDRFNDPGVEVIANPRLVTRGSGLKTNTKPKAPKKPRKGSTKGV